MILPNLDPSGGHLLVDQVLIDYDGPQFFVARNGGGSYFFGLHTLSPPNADLWLYVRVTTKRIQQIVESIVSIRQAFVNPEFGRVALHQIYFGPELAKVDEYEWLSPEEVREEYLPHVDSYLEDPKDILLEAEVAVESSPIEIQQIVERAQYPLWEFDPVVVNLLKRFKTPPHVSASRTRRSVIDFAFSVQKSRTDFPVRSLSSVLGVTQSLVDALAMESTVSTGRGQVYSGAKGRTALDAVATFPSSFGLRLESNLGEIDDNGPIEIAVQRLVDLLSAVNNSDLMKLNLRKISKRAQNHFKAFSKAIASGKADFRIETATPNQGNTTRIDVSESDILWLTKFLEAEVTAVEREFKLSGRLLAVSLRSKFFLLQNDEGEEISGRITKECLKAINEKRINVEHDATILEIIDVNEATGEELSKFFLINLAESSL